MRIPSPFQPQSGAQGVSINRLLRRVLRKLSRLGGDRIQGETELSRLSGLPSCCFAHFADKQK
jgi:hypothetical protein